MKRGLVVGAAGGVLAALLTALMIWEAAGVSRVEGVPYVRGAERADEPIELMLGLGDGQAFAALARDPSLSHPEAFRAGAAEAAYRAQRPLLGYLAWLVALGDGERVPESLVALGVLAAAVAAGSAALLLRSRGVLPGLGVGVVVLPGSVVALQHQGPELLALGLIMAGIVAWERSLRLPALALFALAGLARETSLIVPIALGLVALARRDRWGALVAGVPVAAWLGWIGIVHARFGAWPFEAAEGRLDAPLSGMLRGLAQAPTSAITVAMLVLGACIVGWLVVLRPREILTPVALAFVVLAGVMGADVWQRWQSFSRPLLPLYALGMVALLGRVSGFGAQRGAARGMA